MTKPRTTVPKGLSPPGSARPVRGKPNALSATDVPVEVPVFVHYERHMSEPRIGRARHTGKLLSDMDPASQLLGWTCVVEAFTFGENIQIKVGHDKHVLEVWAGGACVYTSTRRTEAGSQIPPCTYPRFDPAYKRKDEADSLHDLHKVIIIVVKGKLIIDHHQEMEDDDFIFDDDDDDFVEE